MQHMDWFERITGFREVSWADTQARLSVQDGRLVTPATDYRPKVGSLETPTLDELRRRVAALPLSGRTHVDCVSGDARELHGAPENEGALMQVASQFNLLEMVGPDVSPEHGVTRYIHDRTQGPACAIAAGAATIYRNYLAEVHGGPGQTRHRQVDCLADLGRALGNADGSRWAMRNGYALPTRAGLEHVDRLLANASAAESEDLLGLLRIGLHWDAQVTDVRDREVLVSQAFCSALPIAYARLHDAPWERFARLVLDACYEATLLAACLNAAGGASRRVLLTRVGGGAFGNDVRWINAAIERAVDLVMGKGLEVVLVAYGQVPDDLRALAYNLNRRAQAE